MIAQIDSVYVKTRPLKGLKRLLSYGLFEGRPLTTRGQWINPFVFTLFNSAKRVPVLRQVRKPIFVVGTGRSGTTILGVVLSMHRDIGFLNEPKALWHSAYPFEDLIGSYSRGEARYRLGEEDSTLGVIESMHRLYSAYLLTTNSGRVVDKYPELIFRVPFVKSIFPDAKFLFLVRNGWDTCLSIEHWSERLGEQKNTEVHDWWGVNNRKWDLIVDQVVVDDPDLGSHIDRIRGLTRHVDMAAVEWIVTMREGMRLRERYPESVHTVIYEELASNPHRVLPDLLNFCELPQDEKFYQYGKGVLNPARPKSPVELDECLRIAFADTMTALGY